MIYGIVSAFLWGLSDLFCKIGSEKNDRLSQHKFLVWTGIIFFVQSVFIIKLFGEQIDYENFWWLFSLYMPVGLTYFAAVALSYVGYRELDLAYNATVQNGWGMIEVFILLLFRAAGKSLGDHASALLVFDCAGAALVILGVAFYVYSYYRSQKNPTVRNLVFVLIPVFYCILDGFSTILEIYFLDQSVPFEISPVTSALFYGIIFSVGGFLKWLQLVIMCRTVYNPFSRTELPKALGSLCDCIGCLFYFFAAGIISEAVIPVVSCYCIISAAGAKLLLKEKITLKQMLYIAAIITGIIITAAGESIFGN